MGYILYQPDEIRRKFPADTSLITILRHPFQQMQYELHHKGIKASNEKLTILERSPHSSHYSILFNIPESIKNNTTLLRRYLDNVYLDFKLVGITEYFQEFLVLMKRKLCWSLEDLIYLNPGVLPYLARIKPDLKLHEKHRQVNTVDYAIYDYFTDRLLSELAKQDSSFNDEFFHFTEVNKQVNLFCSKFDSSMRRTLEIKKDKKFLQIPSSPWNSAFNVTMSSCATMKLNNKVYQDIFLIKRYPHLCNNSRLYSHKQNLSGLCKVDINTTIVPRELLFDPDAYVIDNKRK